MKRSLLTLLAVSLLSLLSLAAPAQDAGTVQSGTRTVTLTGAVYDENGAVIIDDTKVVARGAGGKVYEAGVNDEGVYTLRLPPGVYDVEASARNFCPWRVDRFRVVDATHGKMSLDFALDVRASHVPCTRGAGAGRESKQGAKNAVPINE